MRLSFVRGSIALAAMLAASRLSAQTGTGAIAGVVNDANKRPLAGAIVQVVTPRLGAYTGDDGRYRIDHVPAGAVRVMARIPGFVADTESVTVTADQTVTHDFALRPASVLLQRVDINSPRMNETKAAALQEQKTADNIVSVLSGDEIRSLPNANAAEAAARMPGVTAERDEGEGKFVEIRGSQPTFTNVQIDGVHIPGTLSGDRSVKLDDIPSDVLGAIEVQKTLTADMDANAIGGTVNLVSKIPEGAPRGYLSAQYGYVTLENNSNGQFNGTYGGRLGSHQQLGFLLGGSYDRTNRVLEDVEPGYTADNIVNGVISAPVTNGGGFNHYYPSNWSEREYDYYRTRYGVDGDLDYRFSPTSSVYLRGLWSAFFDQANVWHTEVNGGTDMMVNGVPTVVGSTINPNSSNRGPIEHTWGGILGGKELLGPVHFDWNGTYSGSSATYHNTFSDNYTANPNSVVGANNFAYTYGSNSRLVPRWYATDPSVYSAIHNGSNYSLTNVGQGSEGVDGQNVGGGVNALIPFSLGNLPASFKIGAKYYNEHKSDNPNNFGYSADSAHNLGNLGQYESNYTVNGYYGHICNGCYPLAPFGSIPAVQNVLGTNPFTSQGVHAQQTFNNLSGTWAGTEQVSSLYGMQTLDVDLLHINIGLRAEQTHLGYEAFSQDPAGDQTVASLIHVHKQHTYWNLFPSALLRFALDENTNLRASIDFAIARPDYADLIPTFNFPLTATPNSVSGGISAANPALKPERSVNYDLLFEHYFPSVGVISGGTFYKQISDFIFNRVEPYNGQFILEPHFLPSNGQFYYITQKQNGPAAWEYGFEADYTQHLTFLPGAFRGIGFDLNWTYVHSRATVQQDTTVYHGDPFRHAMLQRQFPNLFNTSLLYDYGPVAFRLSGEYQAASIYAYGQDGSSNPQSGDNWNFPHWQIDGSLIVNVYASTALQFQVLNLNNETFGFFNGNGIPGTGHGYNVQREYTGRTLWIGVRQGI